MGAAEVIPLPQDLVFVDLETTGGNAAYHRITEVGIVRVRGGVVLEEWSALVNPECRIPPAIQRFTGITDEMVAAAPRFVEIARLVLDKLGTGEAPAPVFVAHNARFDYSFLRTEFRRADVNFCAKVLCTVRLSRRLFPEHVRHNLDAVMERHQLVCRERHRALGDARVLGDFWRKLLAEVPQDVFAAAAGAVLGANQLPPHLPAGIADELPEGAGVYRFFGADEVLLYIGKSNSLRTRILGHFAAIPTDTKQQKLGTQVRRIDWTETAGELGALLLEAQSIKARKPVYNRRLKGSGECFTIEIGPDTGAASFVSLVDKPASALPGCYGLFHSQKDARRALIEIARAHGLCQKALQLEPDGGSCFAFQVGKCKGACVGKEPLPLHAVRALMVLSALKLKSWPFPGRVAISEYNPLGAADLHVVDQWSYLGTARDDDELAALAAQPRGAGFDADIYRILVRYFAKFPRLEWHDLRSAAPRFKNGGKPPISDGSTRSAF